MKITVWQGVFFLICQLFLLSMTPAQANKIQLAYLQIESQIEKQSEKKVAGQKAKQDKLQNPNADNNTVTIQYQAMWKQPANSNIEPLSLKFSDTVVITKKTAPVILNGSTIQYFTLSASSGLANKSITIVNLEKTNVEVMIKYSDSDNEYAVRLTSSAPHYTFKKSPSSWQTIQSYTLFGIEHILEGYDHLLFVLCLLLISTTIKKLLWAITGFTVAHSITLVLSTLGIVQLPIVVVEAVIALSIVFLALEIAKNNSHSLSYRYPVLVSSSFGLLHGFGFASVLLELGLPKNDQFLALAFFNIGVELGQLFFIACVLLVIGLVKKLIDISKERMKKHEKVSAYVIGAIASMWLIERVMQF